MMRRIEPSDEQDWANGAWIYVIAPVRSGIHAEWGPDPDQVTILPAVSGMAAPERLFRIPRGVRRIALMPEISAEVFELPRWIAEPLLLIRSIAVCWRAPTHISRALLTAFGLLSRGMWQEAWRRLLLRSRAEVLAPHRATPVSRADSPKRQRPEARLRLAMITPSLMREGAPLSMYELATGLRDDPLIEPVPIALHAGPLQQPYASAGLPVLVAPIGPLLSNTDLDAAIAGLAALFRSERIDAVVANTAFAYPAILAAAAGQLPSIWILRESGPAEAEFAELTRDVGARAMDGLNLADRIVFVAAASARKWARGIPLERTCVIRNALRPREPAWSKTTAREQLGIGDDRCVVAMIGTLCERKGQVDLINAVARLPAEVPTRLSVIFVGALDPGYTRAIETAVASLPPERRALLRFDPPTDAVDRYLAAADILVCCSRAESFPRVTLEAMAQGLAIVTTPVDGIVEQVENEKSALFYPPGDVAALASLVAGLAASPDHRRELGAGARSAFDVLSDYPAMIDAYRNLVLGLYTD